METETGHQQADADRGRTGAIRSAVARTGVASRLVIAVALPVAVLLAGAAVLLSQRYSDAQQAAQIVREVSTLNGIVNLRAAIDQERIPTEGLLREHQLGVSLPDLPRMLGFGDVTSSSARAAVDRQLAALGSSAPSGLAAGLRALRRQIDSATIGASAADRAFIQLEDHTAEAFATRLLELNRSTDGLSQGRNLYLALQSLADANNMLAAAGDELSQLSNVYLAPNGAQPADYAALGGAVGVYTKASEPMVNTVPAVNAAWQRYIADPQTTTMVNAVTVATTGSGVPTQAGQLGQVLPLVPVFKDGYQSTLKLYTVVRVAEQQVRADAAAYRSASTHSFYTLLAEVLGALILTILVALALARSISTPLRRLLGHAEAVSEGVIDLEPLPARGPRETVVVGEAFNDLVSNLRLLEAKTRALAQCAFTDPILSQPLPGRLGEALDESASVLSGSITERDALAQRLTHQATHDSLTGLHNRAAAVDALEQVLARAGRNHELAGILLVDLDDFKRANDTHGHQVGDFILTTTAERIRSAARRGDFVARIGADQFLLVAEGIDDANTATELGHQLIEQVAQPIDAGGGVRVTVGASVGVVLTMGAAEDLASQLLAHADLAAARAKRAGGAAVEIYDESLQKALIARAGVEQDLHAALDEGGDGLFLQYQPVIEADSGRLAAVEALVRWDRRGHDRCQPGDFIPHAEASDLIIRLDRWVLDAALRQMLKWDANGGATPRVAVNVSGRHLLSGNVVDDVAAALDETGVDPSKLVIEVTETVLLSDLETIASEIERLRQRGVQVAIDDFGTGYTSLAHLQHLTFDVIKIDRSLVNELATDRNGSLVRMVTELGHHLGVSIVAEGVETEEQLHALREVGCDELQGFYIGRPLDVDQLAAWHTARAQGPEGPLNRAAA